MGTIIYNNNIAYSQGPAISGHLLQATSRYELANLLYITSSTSIIISNSGGIQGVALIQLPSILGEDRHGLYQS